MSEHNRLTRACQTRRCAGLLFLAAVLTGCPGDQAAFKKPATAVTATPDEHGVFHVREGGDVQSALDAAAAHPTAKTVRVHEGVYYSARKGQAFLAFTARHDGVRLEAAGDVVLSACNPGPDGECDTDDDVSVSHVVYFGDGVSSRTVLAGFRITGANRYVGDPPSEPPLEPSHNKPGLKPGMFFYLDGGGIKIFGRSYPSIERTIIEDNETRLCGGGVSIEHRGFKDDRVRFDSCVFKNNRCPATGSAVDVLEGGAAEFVNCLFVGNVGNFGMDAVKQKYGLSYNAEHGSGALTVFPNSHVTVSRCTFTGNWNGVDDHGDGGVYRDCILWNNTAGDGSRPGKPYEFDVIDGVDVTGCWVGGRVSDLHGAIDPKKNRLSAPDPEFDALYRPRAEGTADAGYRPKAAEK